MLARAWRNRIAGLAQWAATVGAWVDSSFVSRSLGKTGAVLGAALATSVPARVLWWDRWAGQMAAARRAAGTAARPSARRAPRWAAVPAIVAGVRSTLAAALVASLPARLWRWVTSVTERDGIGRSLTVQLLFWYYRERSRAEDGRAPAVAVAAATAETRPTAVAAATLTVEEGALQLLRDWTVLSLHMLIWLLPVVNATRLMVLAALVVSLMSARVLMGERVRGSTLAVPFAAYLAMSVLATLASVHPTGSLRDLAIVVGSGGVLFAIMNLKDRRDWYGLLASTAAVATLVAAYGLYQAIRGVNVLSMHWLDPKTNPGLTTRVFSTFGNPNILAEYLLLVVPAVVGLLWSERHGLKRLLFLGVVAVTGLCMVLTFSRGAWLGTGLAVLVFLAIMEARVLLVVPIVAIGSYFFLPSVIHARLASIVNLQDASNAYRMNIWIAALHMIRDYWVTGVGFGYRSFMLVYQDYKLRAQIAFHSHNQYLEQFVELGIMGLALFIWLMLRVVAAGGPALRRIGRVRADPRLRAVVAGCVASVAGVLFYGIFENIFYLPTVILTFWVTAGLGAAAGLMAADDKI